MIKLKNIFNAFTQMTIADTKLSIDPWITNGIYHGSWHLDPKINIAHSKNFLKSTEYCIVSHIHEDHFDIAAIKQLSKKCKIILPNLWPNNIASKRKLPGREIILVDLNEPYRLKDNIIITFIEPMNGQGHLINNKKPDNSDNIVLDTGILIESDDKKILLLCDNFPWDFKKLSLETKDNIKDCEMIFLPFNSFADDFPICFDNFSQSEKLKISTKRNNLRLEKITEFVNFFTPKYVIPYSSDFFIKGKRAKEFDTCHPDIYKSRHLFAKELSKHTRSNILAISNNQTIEVTKKLTHITGDYIENNFSQICENLFSNKPNEIHEPVNRETIDRLIHMSSVNMFDKMKKLNLKSSWSIQLELSDQENRIITIDPERKLTFEGINDSKYLRCIIDSGHLSALLNFKSHWDNERISYNLTWKRSINEYEPNINKAINFLHI